MKKIISAVLLLCAQSVFADVPVTLSGPSPAINANYDSGTSHIITYTMTNHVPKLSFPITVSGISKPLSRVAVPNDCGNEIYAGTSTCNIGILIAPTKEDVNKSINQTLMVNYQGRMPLTSVIHFSVSEVFSVLTAVGEDVTGDHPPLLAVSTDLGRTWGVKQVDNMPNSGLFRATSCSGSGVNAVCTAVGSEVQGENEYPLITQSIDGGVNWRRASITNLPVSGYFASAHCTVQGNTALCIAVGRDYSNNKPLIAVSANGGSSWEAKSFSDAYVNYSLRSISCSDSVCTAAGINQNKNIERPVLLVSTNAGASWEEVTFAKTSQSGFYHSVSCTGSGDTSVCAAAGMDVNQLVPLLAVSTNGGKFWQSKAISNLPKAGFFTSVNCSGNGSTATCIAGGRDLTGSRPPIIAMSHDGGNTWTTSYVANLPTSGAFMGVSCSGSSPTAVCTAAGTELIDADKEIPFLAVSSDGGSNWETKSVDGLPAAGFFNATHCAGEGATAVCTAAGRDVTGSAPPYLAISTDGGHSWSGAVVAGLPVSGDLVSVSSQ